MPKFQVTGPDGKSYEVEAPAGATEDQGMSYVRENAAKQEAKAGGFDYWVQGLADQAVQGVTFGHQDELMGLRNAAGNYIGDLMSGNEPKFNYEEERDKIREKNKKYAAAYPKSAMAANVLGGVSTAGFGSAKAGMKAAELLPKIPRYVRYGITGGTIGSLAGEGYSEGENLKEVLADTASGGVQGAALGVALPAGFELAGKGYRAAKNAIQNYYNPQLAAKRKLIEALMRDNTSPGQVSARLRTLGPRATIADAGGANVRRLAETTANRPGKAANIAERIMNRRVLTQAETLGDAVDSQLTKTGFFTANMEKTVARANAAKQAYQSAYSAKPVLESPRVAELLKNRTVQAAIKRARINPAVKDLPDNSIQLLDAAYKEIGGMARKNQSYAMEGLRRELFDAIKAENPQYAEAVRKFADDSTVLNAMENGRKLFRLRPEEIRQAVSELGDDAREAFRIGAADAIKERLSARSDTANAVRAIANSPKMRAQLRAVFPNSRSYRLFMREVMREGKMFDTATDMLRNSRTAARLAGESDLSRAPGVAVDMAMGNKVGAAAKGLGAARDYLTRQPEGVANELAPILFQQNPQNVTSSLTPLTSQNIAQRALNQRLLQALSGAGGVVGGSL